MVIKKNIVTLLFFCALVQMPLENFCSNNEINESVISKTSLEIADSLVEKEVQSQLHFGYYRCAIFMPIVFAIAIFGWYYAKNKQLSEICVQEMKRLNVPQYVIDDFLKSRA
ncbi:MAG: hypothetical protein WD055_06315 [Candidatus Dependentiae bacterium]